MSRAVDENIVRQMQALGFDAERLLIAVTHGHYNDETAMCWMLQRGALTERVPEFVKVLKEARSAQVGPDPLQRMMRSTGASFLSGRTGRGLPGVPGFSCY